MDKSLRNQIMGYIPEKIDEFRKDAQKHAEEEFARCCEKIAKGDFTPIAADIIVLEASNLGTSVNNCLWQNFYDEKIAAMFASEGVNLEKVERTFRICGRLYLKI